MKQAVIAIFWALVLPFAGVWAATPDDMAGADIVILGEVHDNPAHHRKQASIVAELRPAALVFEMLSAEQAARISGISLPDQDTLRATLGWDQTGWPDFSMYYPIFAAGSDARIYGAGLTREMAREAMKTGITAYFGSESPLYGLDQPLAKTEQAERQDFQRAAHCDALPEDMLPTMVGIQRLRDATLARTVATARAKTGGIVVVITGNGHARKDWGLAAPLQLAQPGLLVYALGQSEGGHIDGVFDEVLDYPGVERPDPCLVFQQ